ncbi:uncharacterized protein LOC133398180 [Phycodurus eques]|uniref:uncharacterized protein LOC133398180 n=1 Tax=Phycodurus eques TaxID=693459 RepID=UPI002ACDC8AB|nr:uncharacterized protein LOC133398180 [Phycodurus eques]
MVILSSGTNNFLDKRHTSCFPTWESAARSAPSRECRRAWEVTGDESTCTSRRKRRPRLLSHKSAFTQTASADMNRVLVCVLTAALSLGNGQQTVHQPAGDVHAVEGARVTLDCSFDSTRSDDWILWYKQEVNAAPEFVLSISKIGQGKTEKKYADRFRSSMDASTTQAPLHIESVKLSDSALYYCALRPTLTHPLACLHKNTCTRLVPRHIGGVVSRESTSHCAKGGS